MSNRKILFISAWYPHRYDAMAGLFVRKHASAVAKYEQVCVLFPFQDNRIKKNEIVCQQTDGVCEVYVYYPAAHSRIVKALRYWKAVREGYSVVLEKFGKPHLTHVNVLTRSGIFAYFLKKRYKIPYIITEHWTRYFPQIQSYAGFFHKKITEYIVKQSSCVTTVSQELTYAMQRCGLQYSNYKIVNNVVDDFFYDKQLKITREKKRILHVSCFTEQQKNIMGILRVVQRLSDERHDFELVIVGTGLDYNRIVAEARNFEILDSVVSFIGEQTPQQVSEWMRQSDCFLLFSNYETFGVVIAEALASGIPVVSTNVGIVPHVISSSNGKIIDVGDEDALYEQLNWMLDHFQEYKENVIRESANSFRYDIVGKELCEIYETAIERS